MASVKRRGKVWVACFTLPNGQRKQVSAHTTDENEAMQIALSYEKAANLAKNKRLTESAARRLIREISAVSGYGEIINDLSVAEFLRPRIENIATRYRNERSRERYTYALTHFRDKSGLRDRMLSSLTRGDAVDWREALLREGLSPTTVNFQLGAIRAAFSEAVDRGYLDLNPFAEVRVKGARRHAQHRQPFTFEQFAELVVALSMADCPLPHADEWRLLILLAGYTGQRKSDCVKLQAEAINLRRGVIGFWRSKNGDWHEVPLHPVLARELAPVLQRLGGKGSLLPNLAALPPRGRKGITDMFRLRVLPLIGIVQPYQKPEDGMKRRRVLSKLSFHSLRHSLSSWLNAAGVSDVDRMALVGHDDREVSRGYTHAGLANAQRAIALIPEVGIQPAVPTA
jgi:integrase